MAAPRVTVWRRSPGPVPARVAAGDPRAHPFGRGHDSFHDGQGLEQRRAQRVPHAGARRRSPPSAATGLMAEITSPRRCACAGTRRATTARRAPRPRTTCASRAPLDGTNFDAALALPAAAPRGELRRDAVGGRSPPGATYWFAMRATDDFGNVGPMSAPLSVTVTAPSTNVSGGALPSRCASLSAESVTRRARRSSRSPATPTRTSRCTTCAARAC